MLAVLIPIPLVLLPMMAITVQPKCGTEPIAPTAIESPVLTGFNQRVDAYMQVHNDVEQTLAMQRVYDDPEEMYDALAEFQSGIRAARPDARPGTIFTADVSALIRARLERRLVACNDKVESVLAFINEERLRGAPQPRVYEPFPWSLGSAMWPALLPALPMLPVEMQYRFADRDLVLVDMHADIIVDILVDALPAPASREHGAHHR